jgi:hypothetical protein
MAPSPAFADEQTSPTPSSDVLDRLRETDRRLRGLTAQKSVDLTLARDEILGGVPRGQRMLAERSFRAQIAALLTIPEGAAENLIGYSSALREAFPATLNSVRIGDISWQHATVIVDELAGLDEVARGALEDAALGRAPSITPGKLGRFLRQEREAAHPETISERHETARHLRGVSVDDGRDGMSTLFYTDSSVRVHAVFNRISSAARGIDGPLESRTVDQRRADVFSHVLLAEVGGEQFGVVPDDTDDENFARWFRGIKAEVVISVPVLTLLGRSDQPATLDGCVPIEPETARLLAGRATSFVRILTHPETGATLSVGRKRYKIPKDLRVFLQIRDQTCRFPGCVQPARLSDIDHTVDWQFGGETRASNLACLCPGHHTLKGDTAWAVVQSADGSGVLTWTDPSGHSYRTYPQTDMAAA